MSPDPRQAEPEHMLLFRSTNWEQDLSPEELQAVLDETTAWFGRLREAGKIRAAQPLFEEGKIVSGSKGETVSDGPFAESKETIAGYLILKDTGFDEALGIARTWPLLECGATLEIRPVAPECPSFQRIRERSSSHAVA
ncbi:hypothetical protein BH23VER1_BH23VER1_07600 [soil metagenome]